MNSCVTRELETRLEQIRDRDMRILGLLADQKLLNEIRKIVEISPGNLSDSELLGEIRYMKVLRDASEVVK